MLDKNDINIDKILQKMNEMQKIIANFEANNNNVCEAEILTDREIAKMNNKLVEAKYNLTLEEMKLIFLTIVQINTDDENFKTYKISLKDLEAKTGSLKKHSRLKDFMSSIMKKPIFIDKNTVVNWFSYIHYNENEANLDVRFDKALKPFLLDLKNNFTKFNIQNVLTLKSIYAVRIYQLLKQYEKIGKRKFVVEELQTILQTPKSYQNFQLLRNKVLDVATKEINEKTDLKVKYEITKRVRRKVVEIEFTIRKNESVAKALETKKNEAQAKREAKYKQKKECYNIKKEVATTTQTQKIYEAEIIETTQNNIIKNDDVIDNNTIKKTFKFIKNFKDFREFLTNDLNEYYFILNDDIYTLVANLLCKNNQKLTSEKALESWNLLFKNRNNEALKVYDEAEYKNYLQLQAEKKQKLDDYMNKAIEFIKNKTYKIIDLNDIEKEYKVTNVEIVEATFTKQIVAVYLQNNYFENFTFTANVKNATNNDKIKLIMKDDKLAMMFVR